MINYCLFSPSTVSLAVIRQVGCVLIEYIVPNALATFKVNRDYFSLPALR